MTTPLSVLLPLYNGEPYLHEAIESILKQTHTNFELIILNDGSIDNSLKIAKQYMYDPRVRIYDHPNRGLPATLNRGIKLASNEIIARMDQDDISLLTRFDQQVAFLVQHPEVGILGTSYRLIDTDGRGLSTRFQLCTPSQLHWQLYAGNPICHGTVMFRKSQIIKAGGYDPDARVEDYDLWTRAAGIGIRLANLAEVLYEYRVNIDTSMVSTNRDLYRQETARIRARLWVVSPPPLYGALADWQTLNYLPNTPSTVSKRTRSELHLICGIILVQCFRKRGLKRRMLTELRNLFWVHCRKPRLIMRLTRHIPRMLFSNNEDIDN